MFLNSGCSTCCLSWGSIVTCPNCLTEKFSELSAQEGFKTTESGAVDDEVGRHV